MLWIYREKKGKSWLGKPRKLKSVLKELKQFCGVERCQARRNNVQRAHIMMALRVFLRFEIQRIRTGFM